MSLVICPECGGMCAFDDHVTTTGDPWDNASLFYCEDEENCGRWVYVDWAEDRIESSRLKWYRTTPIHSYYAIITMNNTALEYGAVLNGNYQGLQVKLSAYSLGSHHLGENIIVFNSRYSSSLSEKSLASWFLADLLRVRDYLLGLPLTGFDYLTSVDFFITGANLNKSHYEPVTQAVRQHASSTRMKIFSEQRSERAYAAP